MDYRQRDKANDCKPPLILAYYTVDYVKNAKATSYWRNRILNVAKNFADYFIFAVSAKCDFQHELNEFGYDYVKGQKRVVFARDAKHQNVCGSRPKNPSLLMCRLSVL